MRKKLLKIFKSSLTTVSVLMIIILWTGISYFLISSSIKSSSGVGSNDSTDTSATNTPSEAEDCNVYGINLHGDVVTYNGNDAYNDQGKLNLDQTSADEVVWAVKKAEDTDTVKAIVVEIDSNG